MLKTQNIRQPIGCLSDPHQTKKIDYDVITLATQKHDAGKKVKISDSVSFFLGYRDACLGEHCLPQISSVHEIRDGYLGPKGISYVQGYFSFVNKVNPPTDVIDAIPDFLTRIDKLSILKAVNEN